MVTNSGHVVRQYDTVRDCVIDARRKAKPSRSSHSTGQWSGPVDFDTACGLALNGWSDLRPLVDETLLPINEKLSDVLLNRQDLVLDTVGYEPNIDAYLGGEIEHMWDFAPTEQTTKVINLLCNNDATAKVSPETIARRGAAIAGLCEAFAIMGCEVNVWAEISSKAYTFGGGVHSVLVNVHQAGTYMDINNIMFPIAHPGWLRRIMFGLFEGEDPMTAKRFGFDIGSGAVHDVSCAEIVDASIIMSASKFSKADTDPQSWIFDQLKLQGVIPE